MQAAWPLNESDAEAVVLQNIRSEMHLLACLLTTNSYPATHFVVLRIA